jgi:hypothetical protein
MPKAKILRQASRRFADDLQMVQYPDLEHFIRCKRSLIALGFARI